MWEGMSLTSYFLVLTETEEPDTVLAGGWLLAHRCGVSVMRFAPHTGRTHQIRVHCSAAGFPVLADPLYGGGKEALDRIPVLERPFAASVYKCFGRHALHAQSITFVHPHSHKEQTISAPLPEDFKKALASFETEGLRSNLLTR